MAQTLASGKTISLAVKLTAAATTLTATTDVWVTAWRFYFKNNNQVEWLSFTWVSANGSNFDYTWLTRGLSQTADPSTAWTGKTWLATQAGVLVAMHDLLLDKNQPTQLHQEALTYATTAARDSALWGDWVCTFNYVDIKVTATWLFYNYNTTSNVWEIQGNWTATWNASETASWSVEISTSAQSIAWTDTWETWAKLTALPSDIAKNIQSWAFTFWTLTGADTKTTTLTPTLTAYWTGIYVFTNTTVNTTAVTINIDTLWAKAVQTLDGWALIAWDMANTTTYVLYYDGTQFKLVSNLASSTIRKWGVELSTDAEALAWTDETRYINPKQLKDSRVFKNGATTYDLSTASWTQNIAHWLGIIPKFVRIEWLVSGQPIEFRTSTQYDWTTQTSFGCFINWAAATSTTTFFYSISSWNNQGWVVTFDATNIIITWTKTWTITWTLTLHWEANN